MQRIASIHDRVTGLISSRTVEGVALLLAPACEGRNGGAVVVPLPVQDLPFLPTMVAVGDLADHLVDLLVRLRPRVGVVDAGQAGHLFRELDFRTALAAERAKRPSSRSIRPCWRRHSSGGLWAALA